jgi:hypothetical protein
MEDTNFKTVKEYIDGIDINCSYEEPLRWLINKLKTYKYEKDDVFYDSEHKKLFYNYITSAWQSPKVKSEFYKKVFLVSTHLRDEFTRVFPDKNFFVVFSKLIYYVFGFQKYIKHKKGERGYLFNVMLD